MSCYDEVKSDGSMSDYQPNAGPRVQRDGNNVREVADNAPCFIGHVRPRMYKQRDADWQPEE